MLPGAAAACLLAVLTWQVVAGGPLTGLDMPVHDWVLRHPDARSSPLWAGLVKLGNGRLTLPVLVVAGAAVWWRRRAAGPLVAARPLVPVAASLAAYAVVLELMKITTGRSSPDTGSDAALSGGTEFPSGHTSAAMVIWGMITFLVFCLASPRFRRYRAGACVAVGGLAGVCAAVALVRMDYHWVTDVVGGWLLGGIVLNLMIVAPPMLARRARARRTPARHTLAERRAPTAERDLR